MVPAEDLCNVPCFKRFKRDVVARLRAAAAPTNSALEAARAVFGALADRTRLKILHALKDEELCVCDVAHVLGVTPTVSKVVISEPAEGGSFGSVYLRTADGSPAVRLGHGLGGALSPDGSLVAAMADEPPRILLIPTGAGEPRALATPAKPMFAMAWLPDGKRIVFPGVEEGHGMRLYSLDVSGGVPKSFTPEGFEPLPPGRR